MFYSNYKFYLIRILPGTDSLVLVLNVFPSAAPCRDQLGRGVVDVRQPHLGLAIGPFDRALPATPVKDHRGATGERAAPDVRAAEQPGHVRRRRYLLFG